MPQPPTPPTLLVPSDEHLDGMLESIQRSVADIKMLRHRGLERVDAQLYTELALAVRQLSVAAVHAYSSAGRCPPPPASPR